MFEGLPSRDRSAVSPCTHSTTAAATPGSPAATDNLHGGPRKTFVDREALLTMSQTRIKLVKTVTSSGKPWEAQPNCFLKEV